MSCLCNHKKVAQEKNTLELIWMLKEKKKKSELSEEFLDSTGAASLFLNLSPCEREQLEQQG